MIEGGDPPPSSSHTNPQVWFCHIKGADLLLICSIAAYVIFFFIHCFNFSGKSSTPCVHLKKYMCKPLYCSNVVVIFIFIFLIVIIIIYCLLLLLLLLLLFIVYYYHYYLLLLYYQGGSYFNGSWRNRKLLSIWLFSSFIGCSPRNHYCHWYVMFLLSFFNYKNDQIERRSH